MAETYAGEVRNGVVVFEGESPPLGDGTKVQVKPLVEAEGGGKTLAERLKSVIGRAVGLPSDLAAEHDHYLQGQPKR